MENNLPKFITAAIIYDDQKRIYLIRRARAPEAGRWAFPSGKGASRTIDDPLQAVVKEVESDIGCVFVPDSWVMRLESEIERMPCHFYSGRIIGNPNINYKYCQEGRWFAREAAMRERLAFEQNKVLLEYLKK
jgi:hypothetical protein